MKGYKALKKGMKKSRKKTIYITILRYIYRGTLFWSIFGAFRAIGVYDVTNQNFGLTMLKVLFCCSIMGLSVWGLITIDGYFARRIDRMDTEDVADMIVRPCSYCRQGPSYKCGEKIEYCQKGIKKWLNERV